MKSAVRLDHLATWNEVCDALAYLSRDAFEPGCARDTVVELEAEGSNRMSILCEELAWLRVGNEALDSWLN